MGKLSVVCFKWKRDSVPVKVTGHRLPRVIPEYTAKHVNVLNSMLKRNLSIPFQLFCVTDDSTGIDDDIKIVALWDKYKRLGGCYNRLYTFSEDMRDIFGDRFVCIDLDVVILSDVTDLFDFQDDFFIYEGYGNDGQLHNGSFYGIKTGSRSKVWNSFDNDPEAAMTALSAARKIRKADGTDQAWIRLVLGAGEKIITPGKHGVYRRSRIKRNLPANARMVFFLGNYDPSIDKNGWTKEHWR